MEGQVCLNRGEEKDVENGSLWIYDNEIDWCTDTCRDGDVVTVLDSRRRFCAKGFFNSKSKIVVRVLTRDPEETIDHGFFHKRIRRAWEYRQSIGLTMPAGWCLEIPMDCPGPDGGQVWRLSLYSDRFAGDGAVEAEYSGDPCGDFCTEGDL